MDIYANKESLPVFSALDSETRLKIIAALSTKKMNVKELSEYLHLSSAITIIHLNKLEEANIIRTERHGRDRISILKVDKISIEFPKQIYVPFEKYNVEIPVGQFTKYDVKPSCGLADTKGFIGEVDKPSYFMDPNRFKAGMVWFSEGFIEYQIPNHLKPRQNLEMIEITVELSSEFPFSNNNWPSDINLSFEGNPVGTWTSPGDFSDTRGKYTPKWVYNDMNQYGILKNFRISKHGSFIDGKYASDFNIKDIDTNLSSWHLRFSVDKNSDNVGGMTIFGNHFGNHDQGINVLCYYSNVGDDE